jgi:hypothetical protein
MFTKWDAWNKMTFLYIRNGERLYRIQTQIDFGEKLFPNIEEFDQKELLWAHVWSDGSVDKLVTDRERKTILKKYKEAKKKHKAWCKKWVGKKVREGVPTRCTIIEFGTKKKPRQYHAGDSPWYFEAAYHGISDYTNMEKVNKESVYYDDVMNHINAEVKQYNRIILIIQGLLDRSDVFHPHPIIRLWRQENFDEYVELVYDVDRALYSGPKPDFEAFRERLNESITVGTNTVGQEEFWAQREADRENRRQERDWRIKDPSNYQLFRPDGDPGPGLIAAVAKVYPRKEECLFRWVRKSRSWNYRARDEIPATVRVPFSQLLNVDAYVPGEYKKFFMDPRTRAEYLQWAPLLLAAEDFKAPKRRKKRVQDAD